MRLLAAFAVAVTIAACGSASSPEGTARGAGSKAVPRAAEQTIVIYSSLPLSGPQAAEGIAVEQGIRTGLAVLEGPAGHIAGYKLKYVSLNDAKPVGSVPGPAANAEQAASDPNAALYIGDLDSGATEVSLPILNQAGIVQVAPGSAYVGLTDYVAGGVTPTTEPDRFYPDPKLRNLLRLIPNEMVQTSAILDALSTTTLGPCQRVTAVSFGTTTEGSSYLEAVAVTARAYGMTFVTTKPLPAGATATELADYVQNLRAQTVGCLVLAGRSTATAKALVRLVRADLPHDAVIGTSGYCTGSLGSPGWYCATPVLPLSRLTGGATFIEDYRKALSTHRAPSRYGVYGFMAAELVVGAVNEIEGNDVRVQFQRALLGGDDFQSSQIIGPIEFDPHGDLVTDRRVGLYRDGPKGGLALVDVITPSEAKIVGGG